MRRRKWAGDGRRGRIYRLSKKLNQATLKKLKKRLITNGKIFMLLKRLCTDHPFHMIEGKPKQGRKTLILCVFVVKKYVIQTLSQLRYLVYKEAALLLTYVESVCFICRDELWGIYSQLWTIWERYFLHIRSWLFFPAIQSSCYYISNNCLPDQRW